MEKYARLLGLGEKTGVEIPNESKGTICSPETTNSLLSAYVAQKLIAARPGLSKQDASKSAALLISDYSSKNVMMVFQSLGIDASGGFDKDSVFIEDNRWRESAR
jgi:hypothetical protein